MALIIIAAILVSLRILVLFKREKVAKQKNDVIDATIAHVYQMSAKDFGEYLIESYCELMENGETVVSGDKLDLIFWEKEETLEKGADQKEELAEASEDLRSSILLLQCFIHKIQQDDKIGRKAIKTYRTTLADMFDKTIGAGTEPIWFCRKEVSRYLNINEQWPEEVITPLAAVDYIVFNRVKSESLRAEANAIIAKVAQNAIRFEEIIRTINFSKEELKVLTKFVEDNIILVNVLGINVKATNEGLQKDLKE